MVLRKAILAMQSASQTDLPQGHAVLAADAKAAKERDTYLPAGLETNELGHLLAKPLKWQGSSDFVGFARADSMIFVPRSTQIAKGEVAKIVFL
jgi:molybdopterin biosynthesis enzyme